LSQLDTGTTRSVIVAGVGGLVLGHVLWLVAISLALGSPSSSTIVLIIAALVFLAAAAVWYRAWQRYQHRELAWAAFLAGLPVSPVIFTVIVLGVTYL
jgi:hypothetical protein